MPVIGQCAGFTGRGDADDIVLDLRKALANGNTTLADKIRDYNQQDLGKWLFVGRTFGMNSAQSNPERPSNYYSPLFRSR